MAYLCPHPEGLGAREAMRKALEGAGLHSSDIDYLNLHGTSTPQNDSMEIKAVQAVFADQQVALSSTKHKTGHCLGGWCNCRHLFVSKFC